MSKTVADRCHCVSFLFLILAYTCMLPMNTLCFVSYLEQMFNDVYLVYQNLAHPSLAPLRHSPVVHLLALWHQL